MQDYVNYHGIITSLKQAEINYLWWKECKMRKKWVQKKKKQGLLVEGNQVSLQEIWSLIGIAAQHNTTEQVGFHRGEQGPPNPLFNAVQFFSPSLNRAHPFPCKLQVSLIMPNTNLNECLHQPSSALNMVLQQDQSDFYNNDHYIVFALRCWPFCKHGKMMEIQMTLLKLGLHCIFASDKNYKTKPWLQSLGQWQICTDSYL